MRVSLALACILALSPVVVGTATGQAQQQTGGPKTKPYSHQFERDKANQNLVMLMAGALGGPWIQMAQDVALTVDDGNKLRVLPLAGAGGAKNNLRDVLLLRGVDLTITRLDVLNDAKATGEFGPNLERRVAYITPLAVDMLQVLARPEVNSIRELSGKKVSIFPKGSIAANVFKTLGVEIEEVNLALPDSVQEMRSGQIAASACICSVPIPLFASVGPDMGFKVLEIPYVDALEESFLPASLPSNHYPNQIPKGSKVHTVGTQLILVTYNWPPGSERYRKLEKFVDAFFSKFGDLRKPPRHPSWGDVNISASIRGWQRFPSAKQWLDRQAAEAAASGIDIGKAKAHAIKAAPNDAAEQERLFKEFLEWSRNRSRQ